MVYDNNHKDRQAVAVYLLTHMGSMAEFSREHFADFGFSKPGGLVSFVCQARQDLANLPKRQDPQEYFKKISLLLHKLDTSSQDPVIEHCKRLYAHFSYPPQNGHGDLPPLEEMLQRLSPEDVSQVHSYTHRLFEKGNYSFD